MSDLSIREKILLYIRSMNDNTASFTYHYVTIPPICQIGPHRQSEWELSLVIKGRGRRVIGDTAMPFSDGDLVIVPPGIEHCWYFDNDYTDRSGNVVNITVMFPDETLQIISHTLPETAAMLSSFKRISDAIVPDESVSRPVNRILHEARTLPAEIRVLRLVEILLIVSGGLDNASVAGCRTSDDYVARRRMLIDTFIACNYGRHIGIADIAAHIGMNKSSFCSFFRKNYGDTFIHYLNSYRLEKAHFFLRSSKCRISDICYKSGFQSVAHFNHLFKSHFGISPGSARDVISRCNLDKCP